MSHNVSLELKREVSKIFNKVFSKITPSPFPSLQKGGDETFGISVLFCGYTDPHPSLISIILVIFFSFFQNEHCTDLVYRLFAYYTLPLSCMLARMSKRVTLDTLWQGHCVSYEKRE